MPKSKPEGPGSDKEIAGALQRLHSHELSGVVRYLHYAHMIFGANRIPIVEWLRAQANDSMDHAWRIGEKMTAMGLHPEMRVVPIVETGKHSVLDVLREALDYERRGLADYTSLLGLVRKNHAEDPALEDWVRAFISDETSHLEDAEKMLRTM
jgi:bacterioferritin